MQERREGLRSAASSEAEKTKLLKKIERKLNKARRASASQVKALESERALWASAEKLRLKALKKFRVARRKAAAAAAAAARSSERASGRRKAAQKAALALKKQSHEVAPTASSGKHKRSSAAPKGGQTSGAWTIATKSGSRMLALPGKEVAAWYFP